MILTLTINPVQPVTGVRTVCERDPYYDQFEFGCPAKHEQMQINRRAEYRRWLMMLTVAQLQAASPQVRRDQIEAFWDAMIYRGTYGSAGHNHPSENDYDGDNGREYHETLRDNGLMSRPGGRPVHAGSFVQIGDALPLIESPSLVPEDGARAENGAGQQDENPKRKVSDP